MYADIEYSQLEEPDHSVRLLKLEPSSGVQPDLLVCSIEKYLRGQSPLYTALSYVWESPNSPRLPAIIDGTTVHISSTVENALRRLRFRQKVRWLWVDQLCINQSDEVEKSHQVHQMHHIYKEADQVIAWLGNGDQDSDLMCRLMRDTGRALRSNDLEGLRNLYSGNKEEGSVDLDAARKAFHAFCQRRYWQRLWVMQEFAVGRRIAVACGDWIVKSDLIDQTLDAPEIVERRVRKKPIDGLEMLNENLDFVYSTPLRSYVFNLFTRRSLVLYASDDMALYGHSLLEVVTVSLVLEGDYNVVHATDPRDRIFALLNMAGDKDYFDKFPDYSMSVEDVYRETARKILQQGTIDILMYCQRPKKIPSLPTWVPDWSMDVLHPNSQSPWDTPFKASGKYTSIPTFSDDLATFEGIYVDEVQEIGESWDPNWLEPIEKDAVDKWLKNIRRFCDRSPRIRVGEESADAARIGILDGPTWLSGVPYQEWGSECVEALERMKRDLETSYEDAEEDAEEVVDEDEDDADEDADESEAETDSSDGGPSYEEDLLGMHTRRAFLTSTGYVGVGPIDLQTGDQVCVLLGARIPYLLRPQSDETYSLIGEAYIHGIMYGELVKGGTKHMRNFVLR